MLRAAWLAQEILASFEQEIAEVALCPGEGGVFQVRTGDTLIWCRKVDGGFPQPKDLKQRLRDIIAPGKPLGHSDNPT